MLNFLYYIFIGKRLCNHKWKVIAKGRVEDAYTERMIGKWYDLQCEKCGNIKRKESTT